MIDFKQNSYYYIYTGLQNIINLLCAVNHSHAKRSIFFLIILLYRIFKQHKHVLNTQHTQTYMSRYKALIWEHTNIKPKVESIKDSISVDIMKLFG